MKPKIIMHTQVSLDGRIRGFERPDIYYQSAGRYSPDAVLFGSNTVNAALEAYPPEEDTIDENPKPTPGDTRPLGVIADSRGTCRKLRAMRDMGYLRDVVVLVSDATPQAYIDYLCRGGFDYIRAGGDHADYHTAFEELNTRYGCRKIRTDSGGLLTSVLLAQGLVDEISLVISPCLVGEREPYAFNDLGLPANIPLELIACEAVERDYLSVVYRVTRHAQD
jgi:2,5-diamino-6-(ribosylamino)-4(3H)-pyrimidinone 5'-phosphate reductase